MGRRILTAWTVAAAMLLGAAAPAAAQDLNYFDMLREKEAGRSVVVGVSFRLGEERTREAPRFSLGFSGDQERDREALDMTAYRFAPRGQLSAPLVFADEERAVEAAPIVAAFDLPKARPADGKARAEKPARARSAPVRLASAPKPEAARLHQVSLRIDNPHALAHPHTDI